MKSWFSGIRLMNASTLIVMSNAYPLKPSFHNRVSSLAENSLNFTISMSHRSPLLNIFIDRRARKAASVQTPAMIIS
jgi:hypothetical protein